MTLNKKRIFIIVFLGSIFLITRFQNILTDFNYINGDARDRYYPLAVNLAAGNGFSLQNQPPYLPDDFNQPGYPFFVALIYWVTNGSHMVVAIMQCLLELLIIIITLKLADKFGLSKSKIALVAFFATISPFIAFFTNMLLTEVLATFAAMLLCYLLVLGAENKSFIVWAAAAIIGGLCLLIRPDMLVSVLLMAFAACAILIITFKLPAVPNILLFFVIFALVMTPWTLRNYNLTGKIQPLGRVTEQTDLGYVKWLNTWLVEPKDIPIFWWQRMELKIPLNQAATESFSGDKERVEELLRIAQFQNSFEGETSAEFARLSEETYSRRPVKSYLIVPFERSALTLIRMPDYIESDVYQSLTYSLWLPFIVLALLGMIAMSVQKIFLIPIALLIGRIFLPFYTALGAEPRYIIESLPIFYITAAAGAFWLFNHIQALGQADKNKHKN
jgi:4-amino-4-deoxy-L-arabinose transferase-like glycosyltransferase